MNIRPTTIDDIDKIMEWVNDPTVLEKFANFDPISRERELEFLKKLVVSKNDKTFTIEDNGEYIGQVSINKIYWASMNGRLSITIHPNQRGKGMATEAIKKIIDKGFNEFKLHKLWLMLKTDNFKGIELYQSLGFQVEGVLKDEYIEPTSGKHIDMIRMYKLNV